MLKNFSLGLGGLITLAASMLFLFFIVLSGVSDSTPLNKTYFLRANTGGITGAREFSQWTYFYICGDNNLDCSGAKAAIPFGWAWDSGAQNVPEGLGGSHGNGTTSSKYFYMWRFSWVFIIITLFFEMLAFFSGFLACCGRLGAAISFMIAGFALILHTIATSLFTAVFVKARNRFRDDGREASLGSYGFGWMWGSWAALLVATILFAMGIRKDKTRASTTSMVGDTGTAGTIGGTGAGMVRDTGTTGVVGGFGRRGFFSRRRSTRSYEGRRVKDEYS
ncbi:uncharacterized protein CPUR_04726 [Claviceps purpurea 20.1]|uniref:Uncharacterized protein n=1 Tax=Claviceps purpurea (strain 20.1) TaxID=1111077 RepID=M1W1E8_CLAP2|nr:hypothetical protein E4U37_004779 [Claviceps purpurea]KAG6173631.1 hypothetical protein E4U51_004869 [Claviceps purpurea]KAG6195902.1 hypothetical protein E4U10_001449 [Claviceps purpurea]KAG6246630.1 hypothetical protein E4U23_004496 [Claviceps purpurea]CCE30876.1 uncharacterized protein CPUR_04726 [Claviceps purpurea 20.1]